MRHAVVLGLRVAGSASSHSVVARVGTSVEPGDADTGVFVRRALCVDTQCPTVFDLEYGDLAIGR